MVMTIENVCEDGRLTLDGLPLADVGLPRRSSTNLA